MTAAASITRQAYLTGVRQTDADVSADMALTSASSGTGAYVSLVGRRVSNGNNYDLKVRYMPDRSVIAYLARNIGGTETILASATVPGLAVNTGDVLHAVRGERHQYDDAAGQGLADRYRGTAVVADDDDRREPPPCCKPRATSA